MIDLFFRRWGLKLLAVAIAFAIWLAVVGENEAVRDLHPALDAVLGEHRPGDGSAAAARVEATFDDVPVTVVGASGAASAEPPAVPVTIAGPPALVARIRLAQIQAVVDVTGLVPRPAPYAVPLRFVLADLSRSDLARITVRSVGRSKIEVRISDRRTPS